MRTTIITLVLLLGFSAFSQDHFAGISTSDRVGILNGDLNPAEFSNLSKKFEVNIYGMSFNVANNKIGFNDITSGKNLEDLIFAGNESVNMRLDTRVIGPSVALKIGKWGFGITTKANIKFDIVNVDPIIGNAISNNNLTLATTILNTNSNQRFSGTSWGEVGLSAAKKIIDNDKHTFSAGLTVKLLFPGSYTNVGLNNLNGQIKQTPTGAELTTNGPATLNIAYSGNLAERFSQADDYTKSVFGGLNGMATDIGFNYIWKDEKLKYKIKGGMSIRNIGSMTFNNSNNSSTNYTLNIPASKPLNLSDFENANNLSEVENILLAPANNYLSQTPNKSAFKVNLPTLFTLYGDFKIVPKIYITGFMQQKMKNDEDNAQITGLNIYSVTPRVNLGFFEAYVPISNNDISGTNVGLGFRLGGFYIGSGSIITALSDSKQADLYTGFRWAFL